MSFIKASRKLLFDSRDVFVLRRESLEEPFVIRHVMDSAMENWDLGKTKANYLRKLYSIPREGHAR